MTNREPDFNRVRKILFLEGEPDCVPLENYIAMQEAIFEYGRYATIGEL